MPSPGMLFSPNLHVFPNLEALQTSWEVWGVGLKIPKLMTWLVSLLTSPHPELCSIGHFINITKDTFMTLTTLEIPRVLRALCQKQGQRLNICFL